jgi:hypothetical protein
MRVHTLTAVAGCVSHTTIISLLQTAPHEHWQTTAELSPQPESVSEINPRPCPRRSLLMPIHLRHVLL